MVNLVKTINLEEDHSTQKIEHLDMGVYQIIRNSTETIIEVMEVNIESKTMKIRHQHSIYDLEFKNELDLVLDSMGIKRTIESLNTDLRAPMPGKVIEIVVQEGDKIEKGSAILILEAMKMENVLKAENDCSIKKVHVVSSENVEKNQVLVELDTV
jgi:biotin carboxyl carrier protein